jgi:L-ascorbate metabolism protein UlaG (beta-lactamase superfamily)
MKRSTRLLVLLLCALTLTIFPRQIVFAQADLEEGDIDESFEAYGDDSDEVYEMDDAVVNPVDSLVRGIRWLGHASFLIEDSKKVYIDPYDIPDDLAKQLPDADLILITHDHRDHFSPDDMKKILKPSTVVVSIKAVVDELPEKTKAHIVEPGDTVSVGGLKIEAVPAYNIKKKFHPKSEGHVGFVVHFDKRTIYHAGDTDLIPEMEDIEADVALLPAGGKFTMDATEAAEAANLIKPRVAVPMHWGSIIGSEESAENFVARCKVPARILQNEAKN